MRDVHGPAPRWYRHRCDHANRVVESTALGQILRDWCQDCGAQWPV